MKSPARTTAPPASPSACRAAIFSTRVKPIKRLSTINSQPSTAFFGGALAKDLGDIEVHEIGVMKNNRLDRPLDLVALMTVGGDDVHDFAGNAVLVGERYATERMPQLLTKFSLNHFTC